MQNNLAPIVVKKEGVSDDFYKIIELYAHNGSWVEEGDLILCFETSKTAIDIEAPIGGYVFFDTNENEEISVGQTIAVISEKEKFCYNDWFRFVNGTTTKSDIVEDITVKISKPAQRLIDQNNIDIAVFNGALMITREDVENYLSSIQTSQHLDDITIDENSLLIFGGGGHAKMCIDVLKQTKTHSIIGIVDDNIAVETEVLDIPVIGNILMIDKLVSKGLKYAVLGVGGVLNKGIRKKIFLSLKESVYY